MNPLLVWGLFPRLLALVYVITFASLLVQIVPMAGADGVSPIKPLLRKIRADYQLWRCWLHFPTLLWLRSDDRCLRGLPLLGMAGGLWAIVGGPWSNLGLLLCWMCYLSLNHAVGLAYPWECLLLEAGFLGLFLPSPDALPDFTGTPPLPAIAWAFHWLVFRMVFGFGKLKFRGVNRKELGYLKAFFVAVPLPGPLGWYGHHLPAWFMKLSLLGLFLIEVPIPFLVFIPGYPRLIAAAAIVGLMLAIQATGNYGHFNILMLVLCVPLLDAHSTLFAQPLDEIAWPLSHLLVHLLVLILFVGGLLYLPANSWSAQSWLYWPSLRRRSFFVRWLAAFYRVLAPFRILHAYGVFPSISFPAARVVSVIEGTDDGKVWKEYGYRWQMTGPGSPPVVVAPHTPRLDHFLFYDAYGADVANFLGSTFGIGNPYLFSRWSGLERVVQRLLEGRRSVLALFRDNPFPDAPPKLVRVSLYLLQPVTLEEHLRTGVWWRRRYLGPHLLPARRDDAIWSEWLPEPESYHPDELIWKLRVPRLRAVYDRVRAGGSPEDAVVDAATGITSEMVQDFWIRFIEMVRREDRRDWKELAAVVRRIRVGFSREQLQRFERIHDRLALALLAKLESRLDLPLFQVWMLISHVIAGGRDAYDDVFRDPTRAAGMVAEMTNETGLFLTAVFRFEKLAYHARKFRLLLKCYTPRYTAELPGFLTLIPFLAQQLEVPGEERYPNFVRRIIDGEWLLVEDEAHSSLE